MKTIKEILDEILEPHHSVIRKVVGDRVKASRESKNLTQKELADKAKVSLTTINRLEKGKQFPHPDNLTEILSFLEIDISDLPTLFRKAMAKNNSEAKANLIIAITARLASLDNSELEEIFADIESAPSRRTVRNAAVD